MKTLSDADIRLEDMVYDALRPKPDGRAISFARPAATGSNAQARKDLSEIEEKLSIIVAKAFGDHPALGESRRKAIGHLGIFNPHPANAASVALGLTRRGRARPFVRAEPPPEMRFGGPKYDSGHKWHWPSVSILAANLVRYAEAAGVSGSADFPPVERLGRRDGNAKGLIAHSSKKTAATAHQNRALAAAALGQINKCLNSFAPAQPGFDSLRQHVVDVVWSNRNKLAKWGEIDEKNYMEKAKNSHEDKFLPNSLHDHMAAAWHGINRRQHLENKRLSVPARGLTAGDALAASTLIRRHAALYPGASVEGGGRAAEHFKRVAEGVERAIAARADAHAGLKGEIAASMDRLIPAKPGNHASRAGFALSVFDHRLSAGRLGELTPDTSGQPLAPAVGMAMKTHAGTTEALAGSLERLHAAIEGRIPLERAAGPAAVDEKSGPLGARRQQNSAGIGSKRQIEDQGDIRAYFKRAAPAQSAADRGLDERQRGPDLSR